MNKFIWMIFALSLVSFVQCSDSDEILAKIKSRYLRNFLNEMKDYLSLILSEAEAICEGASEKVKSAAIYYLDCAAEIDDSLTLCEAIRSVSLNCTQPFIELVDRCLPVRLRGFPTLGLNSFISVVNYLCHQSGEAIFEMGNKCLWRGKQLKSAQDECLDKVETEMDEIIEIFFNGTYPTTSQFCSMAVNTDTCLHKIGGITSCKNPKTKNFTLGLLDAAVTPCDSIVNDVESD